jgi:hypothetical protein
MSLSDLFDQSLKLFLLDRLFEALIHIHREQQVSEGGCLERCQKDEGRFFDYRLVTLLAQFDVGTHFLDDLNAISVRHLKVKQTKTDRLDCSAVVVIKLSTLDLLLDQEFALVDCLLTIDAEGGLVV